MKTALETNEFILAPTGGVITEMKHIISTEFAHCNVLICRRNCNKVAHALAAAGCNLLSGCYNTCEGVPQKFEDLLSSDLAGSDE